MRSCPEPPGSGGKHTVGTGTPTQAQPGTLVIVYVPTSTKRRPDDPSGRMGERPTGRLACSWPHPWSSTCLQLSRGSGLLPSDVLVAWLAGPLSLSPTCGSAPRPATNLCALHDPNAPRPRRLLVIVFAKETERQEIRALRVTMAVASLPPVVGSAAGYWACTRRPPAGDHRPVPSGLCLFVSRVISLYCRCIDVPAAVAVLADNSTHPQGGLDRAKLLQKGDPPLSGSWRTTCTATPLPSRSPALLCCFLFHPDSCLSLPQRETWGVVSEVCLTTILLVAIGFPPRRLLLYSSSPCTQSA
ncbi:hypothetical protein F5B21DRAFT_226825 [Xylaria acuta]|nr:hypothetical protein F5B21DRAFT_226825 [Xylaria acuta]